jgi:large subunit ribosomal protein L22
MEAVAKLNNEPTSPRKMRLLVDLVRGMRVEKALAVLDHNPKHSSVPLRKLILSAISNWKAKNEGVDESELIVKTIFVDAARVIKRMRPAPQGRGYRVRKRSNHVTVFVDAASAVVKTVEVSKKETAKKEVAPVVVPKKTATKKAVPKKKANSETE